MLAQPVCNAIIDGKGKEKGNKPSEHHDLVVPSNIFDDEVPADHPGSDKDRGKN